MDYLRATRLDHLPFSVLESSGVVAAMLAMLPGDVDRKKLYVHVDFD